MAQKRTKKDDKKKNAIKEMERKEKIMKEAAAEMMGAKNKYSHDDNCACPLCRLNRAEQAINQVTKFMNILLPWFDKIWEERGEGINPLTGTIMDKETADKATIINSKILTVENDKSLETRVLHNEINDIGGVRYYLTKPDPNGVHIKDQQYVVMKLGIDKDANIFESVLTLSEYYKELEILITDKKEFKDKKEFTKALIRGDLRPKNRERKSKK